MARIRKPVVAVMAICLVALAVVVYYAFDPARTPFPRCPFLMLTGLQCPGCGSQRAIHALMHLNIGAAWHYNALLVVSVPYVIILLIARYSRWGQVHLYRAANHYLLIWAYFALVILWWVLRNIFGW